MLAFLPKNSNILAFLAAATLTVACDGETGGDAGTDGGGEEADGEAGEGNAEAGDGGGPACEENKGTFPMGIQIESEADIDMIRGFSRIDGALWISGLPIEDLDFLNCLEEVTGELNIFDNDQLTDITGLGNLETVGDTFSIAKNDALTNTKGLEKLNQVRTFQINYNTAMTELNVDSLTVVEKNVIMRYNDVLSDITSMYGLKAVGGTFDVVGNPELCLSQVNRVGGNLEQGPFEGGATTANKEDC